MAPIHSKSNPKTPKAKLTLRNLQRKAYRAGDFDPWNGKRCECDLSSLCTPNNCPQLKEIKAKMQLFKECSENKRLERSKLIAELFAVATTADPPFSPSVKGETHGEQ